MSSTGQRVEADPGNGIVSTLTDKVGQFGGAAGAEANAVVQESKFEAQRVVQQSRETLRAEAASQATRVAGTLRDVGQQLRDMSQQQTTSGVAVDVVRQLSDTAQRAADKLDDGGLDAVMSDLKRFARRRPGMFLAGALGAGFVAGRLLKAADKQSLVEAAKPQPTQTDTASRAVGQWSTAERGAAASSAVSIDLTSEMP